MIKKQTISVAQSTLNEEANIVRNLDAVHNWVDEIIIADEGSTDNTVALTKKYSKVKILNVKHQPMFHLTKQIAIDACKSDWILQLDTDEVVTPGLRDEILTIINSHPPENGFWINRQNYFLGRFLTKGGIYPDSTIRLYRRGKGKLPCLDVHEQAEIDGLIGHLTHDLLHFSDPTFTRYLLRNDRYTSLIAQQLLDQGVKINPLSFINYFVIKPIYWFLSTFIRHRGYVDGFPGFVFCWYSSLRFPISYTKLYELKNKSDRY